MTLVAAVIAPGDAQALGLPEGFSTVEQVAGLDGPTALAYAPDGRLFVAEKAGRVRVVGADGRLHPEPVIDISDHVNSYWDRGLLGIAVDADFATNRSIYLLYVHEANALDPTGAKTSRLTRIRVTSDNELEDPDAPETVLLGSVSQAPCPAPAPTVDCIPADGFSHAIGTVRADPDGTLWLGSGDGTSWRGADPQALRTYDENSLSGKLMHVDREGRGVAGHPFCPTERDLTKVCTKLYAKGFRNPFRFHLRPGAGPVVGDVGWEMREELDVTRRGRSYGWPCYEGTFRTSGYKDMAGCAAQYDAGPTAHDPPSYEYAQAPGDATIVAGPRYEGEQYPAPYRGAWFFGDYSKGLIWRTTIDDQGTVAAPTQFATGFEGGVDLERAPNGDLVYVELRRRGGHGLRPADRLRQPRAGPRRLRHPGTGHRAARGDPERRGHGRPGRGGDDLRMGSRQRRVRGRDRPVGPPHLCRRGARGHAHRSRRARSRGERHGRGPRQRDPADRDPARTGRGSASATASRSSSRAPPRTLQDGELGDAALHWRISIHHGQHTHVVEADRTGAETTFTPPGDHDADSALELRLTARDSAGLEDTESVTLQPETIDLRLESSPPGAALGYAGIDVTAPTLRKAAIGFHPTVSAPGVLERDGRRFAFDHWSDGGERLHEIVIPDAELTLTAVYAPVPDPAPPPPDPAPAPPPPAAPAPPARRRARVTLDASAGKHPSRRLRGRVTGASGPLGVDLALRLRRTPRGCRWWRRELGRLSTVTRSCDRPVWMKAAVDALRPLAPRPPGPPATRALRGPDAGEDRVRAPPGRGACQLRGPDPVGPGPPGAPSGRARARAGRGSRRPGASSCARWRTSRRRGSPATARRTHRARCPGPPGRSRPPARSCPPRARVRAGARRCVRGGAGSRGCCTGTR